jgi:mono/diheme cytochrome c family protein
MIRTTSHFVALGLMLTALTALLTGRLSARGDESPVPEGEELFRTYCASCHGLDATGNGPLALALRHQPSDLTQLSKRNGGMFPGARVRRIIEGRDIESHGDRDMPVWGDVFKKRNGQSKEAADQSIRAIVQYLESLQHRQAQW